jgi:vacuolar iron transporter family protein
MAAEESWREEKQSAWLYRRLADAERDARVAGLFRDLAETAEGQARRWEAQVRTLLGALKVRGLSAYDASPSGHASYTRAEDIGHRHRGVGGGTLRAAVFGVNDGLVSNASLILGMVGAGSGDATVLAAGVAGLLAGALSMAAGEYVSMRSHWSAPNSPSTRKPRPKSSP